jgi:hypothetical protein
MVPKDDAWSPQIGPADEQAADDAERVSRRKLLRAALYIPPAIIGSLLLTREARADTPSCPPSTGCQPNCGPSTCGPDTCKPRG